MIALSFFSGAMGLDIGLERAGFDIALSSESDPNCRKTIRFNRPNIPLLGDINQIDVSTVRDIVGDVDIDLIAGGPPCQSFSTVGKRKGLQDERGNVFLKYVDLGLELEPKYLVIENVRGFLTMKDAVYEVLSRIQRKGYAYSFQLYRACDFGSPQLRERVIIICSRNGIKAPYLYPTHDGNWKTFRKAVEGIETCTHLDFPEKRLRYLRMLTEGQNWKNLPLEIQKEAMGKSFYSGGGKTGFLRRISWDKPSPTLVANPVMPATSLCHPEEDRPLSIEEYRRIQEFPDEWKIFGPLLQQYKQAGNAVPVSLGFAIGSMIRSLIEGKDYPVKNFTYSRYIGMSDESFRVD